MIKYFGYICAIFVCLYAELSLAHVIVLERNAKASVEINVEVIQEFKKLCEKCKQSQNALKKASSKINSKALVVSNSKKSYDVTSEKPIVSSAEQKKRSVNDALIKKEFEEKKTIEDRRLAEIQAKEELLKKAIAEREQKETNLQSEDPKLSRAKNLLRKVEKSLLKNKGKIKEYPVDSEVSQVNLSSTETEQAPQKQAIYSTDYKNSAQSQSFTIKFAKNSNDVKNNMHEQLNKIAHILSSNQDKRVRIIGYAGGVKNDVVTKRRNALERVVAIRKYLVDRGANTRQISLQAAGDSDSKNSSLDNDRVEIIER